MNTYAATPLLDNLDDQPTMMDEETHPTVLGHIETFQLPAQSKRNFCLRSYTDNPYGVSKSRRLYGEYGR